MPEGQSGAGEAGTTVEATETTTTTVEAKETEPFDEARARKTIEAQRESERAAISRAKAAEARVKEFESQTEKQQAAQRTAEERLAALEEKISTSDQRVGKQALRASLAAAGAHYPSDTALLIDMSKLKFDDDGEPTNADDLVEDLKKSKPALFGTRAAGSADGGARGGGSEGKVPSMDEKLRQAAGRS